MPEPTITIFQEWTRIASKLINEDLYEKITKEELKFISSTYDRTNDQIYPLCNLIKLHTFSVTENMINKNNERLNMNDRIEVLIKLYSAITVLISIGFIMDMESYASIRQVINVSVNKISEIKIIVASRLPETNPNVIRLYNVFDRFIEIVNI